MGEDDKKTDVKTEHTVNVPGLPEVGRAVEKASGDTVDGLRGFFGALCQPAAEQYGQAWADHVKQFRYNNHLNWLAKTQKLHGELGIEQQHTVKPRLMYELVEESSMEEDEDMQQWWAGLSVSSIEEVPSDDNLIFINMMKQITSTQRTLIEYMCKNADLTHTQNKLLVSKKFRVSHEDIVEITGVDDIDKLDREIDSLNSMGLLRGTGYDLHQENVRVDITPSPLCLHFFSRCNGRTKNLIEYLGAEFTETCPHCGGVH